MISRSWSKNLLGCIQNAFSCTESTMIRLELSSNLLVAHAFAYWELVCFVSHVIIFGRGKWTNAVSEGCFEKFYKIIWKTLVMEYSLTKFANLQSKTFQLKRDSGVHQVFQKSFCRCIKFFRIVFCFFFLRNWSSFKQKEGNSYYSKQVKATFYLLSMLFMIKSAL